MNEQQWMKGMWVYRMKGRRNVLKLSPAHNTLASTTVVTNTPAPNTALIPTEPSLSLNDENDVNTSGAPLPNANNVTPIWDAIMHRRV